MNRASLKKTNQMRCVTALVLTLLMFSMKLVVLHFLLMVLAVFIEEDLKDALNVG